MATVAAMLVFAALGQWQLNRAADKRALAADYTSAGPALALPADSRPLPRYQRVTARGRYDPDHQFLLDNQIHEGLAGVRVLTPLVLAGGGRVLVNRGWLPFGATRADLPDITVDGDERIIAGRLDDLPRPGILLGAPSGNAWPRLVNYPTMDELAAALGENLHSRVILLDAGVADGYVRDWQLPGTTTDRHIGYAVQWFAFAATVFAIWFAISLRRPGENT